MSETYKAVILRKHQKRLEASSNPRPSVPASLRPRQLKLFLAQVVGRPIHMLLTEPVVGLFDLYVAIDFGILNLFYAAFPAVFRDDYAFSLGAVGLTFLSQVVGNLAGWTLLVGFSKLYYQRVAARGKPPPETRLFTAMLGALMLPVSLFWFAWTARPSVHWIACLAAEALFSCGNMLIFSCASLYFADCYGARFGASAWSSNTFSRYLLAAVFPLFADQMYRGLGTGWATSLLAFVTILLVPIPFLFYRIGARLRKRSRYAGDGP